MRLRHATLAVAALTLLGVAACGDDSDDKGSAAPAAGVSAGPSAGGALGGPGASAAPGASAPGIPPTEGTSPTKPPKKGGGAAQGPAGKPKISPDVLTAAGIGPYTAGVAQSELKSADLIGKVTATKDTCTTAKGLGEYHTPALAFAAGRLQRVTVTSPEVATPAGAKVGTGYAGLKALYPNGKQLDDWLGASAWYAVDGGNALLFRIKADKVAAIDAGAATAVQFFYTDKQGC
ncbi:hypothetical protein GCM10020358_20730 [Amorphoplanes nipponensis]|uniref:Lipoprotein n=1 Tax=Actinoplanes nipponensis TaxID=135950 RepID=A0A919MH60_9ACTN|nr:hypothetical protein [Actinoplanes nipponensis]GIE49324.1 hypothetical protein Ani05nite_28580 [Actinoplanes nipponensis]